MNEPKTITRSQYLQALALYTMASRLQRDAERFNIEMNKVLDLDGPTFSDSRLSDGIYARPSEPFDLILGYVNITVEPEAPALPNGARGAGS